MEHRLAAVLVADVVGYLNKSPGGAGVQITIFERRPAMAISGSDRDRGGSPL